MPLIETKGAASAQGFGGAGAGASGPVTYIEDVFSTWLYTGNGSTQTITNGIDLAGKGGLVWIKYRSGSPNYFDHMLFDNSRTNGLTQYLSSNTTAAQYSGGGRDNISAYNSNGFSLTGSNNIGPNQNTISYVSWTFREQPKFFDVVTYTGNGANRTISHNLGSVPGCIIVKRTDAAADWQVYHRSLANTEYIVLNSTAAVATGTTRWNSTTPTSTVFSLGTDTTVNANGGTYVAYLFAHDAGGFGLSGTDNVISCGSITTNGSTATTINLGWEPQFLLVKAASGYYASNNPTNWFIVDNLRGMTATPATPPALFPNSSQSESNTGYSFGQLNATGFSFPATDPTTWIYIAIRRGPMRVPTSGTSVFKAITRTGTGANATVTGVGFAPDLLLTKDRLIGNPPNAYDRLRGGNNILITSATDTEAARGDNTEVLSLTQNGASLGTSNYNLTNSSGKSYINHFFRRAPGFFDEVCYTGTGVAGTQAHNLGVAPELIITKSRSVGYNPAWGVYHAALGNTRYLTLETTNASDVNASYWNNTSPTSSVFTVNTNGAVNASTATYVAYLFATCPGVSKVGSYTGTGALQTIDCGFTGGARFVLIKRTDSTGDWYVYDSARGISSGNDPYLFMNSSAAEVTGTNYVDTTSVGFQVTAAAPAGLNANGGTYLFLAIA